MSYTVDGVTLIGAKVDGQDVSEITLDGITVFAIKEVVISANLTDANLRSEYDSQYAAPESGDTVKFVIESGVTINSSSTGGPACDVGSWPGGVNISVVNSGRIQGAGGDGENQGGAGFPGGVALLTSVPITLDNQNEIWGGAGGGGGAAGSNDQGKFVGAPGGGGAGDTPGAGAAALFAIASDGQDGTTELGGAGGSHSNAGMTAEGGDGGDPGQDGQSGTVTGSYTSKTEEAGGAAGAAIDGHSNVSYSNTGDIRGPQVN